MAAYPKKPTPEERVQSLEKKLIEFVESGDTDAVSRGTLRKAGWLERRSGTWRLTLAGQGQAKRLGVERPKKA